MASPELLFRPETSLATRSDCHVRARRRLALPASVGVHAAAVAALLVVPLLSVERLPEAAALRVFFVDPMTAPAPPPPPPPAARPAAAVRPAARAEETPVKAFAAPVEVPAEVRPEEGLDLGVPGGVAGGVEGGVPGGVVGGVVGGLLDSAPATPGPVPVRVGGDVKEPAKVRHVDPVYPKVALEARVQGIVIIEAVIDALGHVRDAKVLRGVPILDEAALAAVRGWAYSPTLVDGVPTPVVMTVTVSFRLKSTAA